MNKERILRIADLVEKEYHAFNGIVATFELSKWAHTIVPSDYWAFNYPKNCNTVACIAGYTILEFGSVKDREVLKPQTSMSSNDFEERIRVKAGKFLEINTATAYNLFLPDDLTYDGKQAAKVLRHLAEKEVVDWYIIDHMAE